ILNRRSRIGGTVWETLSKALPDRPGGAVAVTAALRVLLKLSAFRLAALAVVLPLLVLFVGGIALAVAADGGWRALGIVAALFAVGVGVALWVAALKLVSFIRTFVRRRVDAFLGPLEIGRAH